MRWARHSVLPEPAPASTSRLMSKRVRIRSRAAWSATARGSLMFAQPPVGIERRVVEPGDLCFCALGRLAPARVLELAEAAILVGVGRVHEGAGGEQIEQIAQHVHRLRLGRLRAHLALAPSAYGREVV